MNLKKIKRMLISVGRDLLLAFFIVLLIMLILYAYCRVWPPMVVVESGSMEHPPHPGQRQSYVGVIDTGDMVFVKDVGERESLRTYVGGEATDYRKYGSFGDVVIYRPDGSSDRVPIIHRIVVWISVNDTDAAPVVGNSIDYNNYSYDVPALGIFDSRENVTLENYGYNSKFVSFSLRGIIQLFNAHGLEPHSGFITLGDNNPNVDQISYLPVKMEWVVGKAIGELPWFGLIKLSVTDYPVSAPRNSWIDLFAVVIALVSVPFFLDFGWPVIKKKYLKKRGGEGAEGAGGAVDEAAGKPPDIGEPGPAPEDESKTVVASPKPPDIDGPDVAAGPVDVNNAKRASTNNERPDNNHPKRDK
jgi:signal peptidase